MLDYTRIVEEIQAALSSMAVLDWDLMRETAAEYVAACDEVNERLVECAGLLKQGLRSEALQAAEREPNVLDSVGILDFPELPEWHKALIEQGIVLPPPIKNDIAGDLNMAYFAATPLAGLMKTHRLMALARAPLSDRIGVMRQIRNLDLENPIWDQDLRVFEAARLREFPKELATAASAKDLKKATALSLELETPGWMSTPPADLLDRTRKVMKKLSAELAATELAAVEKRLTAAHSAFDEDAALVEKDRWETLIATARLSQDDPLVARAAPALHWVRRLIEQRQKDSEYAASIAGLEDALERDADRRTLERAYQMATRLDFEIPELLERRYAERIRSMEVAEKRKFVLLLSGVIGVLAVAASVTLWIIFRTQHEAQVASSTASLQKLLEADNLIEARKYADAVAAQSKSIAERPVFLEQVARLEGLEREEKERSERLKSLLTRLEAMEIDRPDRGALSEAENLAKSDAETARVAGIRKQVRDADRKRQSAIDVEFDHRFRALQDRIVAAEKEIGDGQPINPEKLSELSREIKNLRSGELSASPPLLAQLDPLQNKITVLIRANDEQVDLHRSMDGLTKLIGNPAAFADRLKQIAERHAGMAGFKLIADEASLWNGLNDWNRLLQEIAAADLKAMPPKDAKRFVESADKLVKDYPNLAEPVQFTAKRALLEGISRRISAEGIPQLELLQRSFEGRLMVGLWLVKGYRSSAEKAEEGRYYTEENPIPLVIAKGAKVAFEPITSLDLTTGKTVRLEQENLVVAPAPQTQLSKDAIAIIGDAQKGDWDATMLKLLGYLLSSKADELDPLLRFITLSRVLEVARDGSHAIKQSFEPISQLVDDANVDLSANWLDWDDKQAESSRAEAVVTFKAIQSRLKDVKASYDKHLAADREPLAPAPKCIGWLRPDKAGKVKFESGGNPPPDGQLFVVYPAPTGAGKSDIIGTVKSGVAKLDGGIDLDVLKGGRLVYLLPDAVSK